MKKNGKKKITVVDNHKFFPPVLLKYANDGYLELNDAEGYLDRSLTNSTGLVRLEAGRWLAYQHYHGFERPYGTHASDFTTERVDGGRNKTGYYTAEYFQQRYNEAMERVPEAFRPVVILVCIENEPIKAPAGWPERERREYVAVKKYDLCRGLDCVRRYMKFNSRH